MIAVHGAVLATAQDFHGPAAYLALCAVAGLEPTEAGYGLLLVTDHEGHPCTAVTQDVDYVRLLLAAQEAGAVDGVEVPCDKVVGFIREWPWVWVGLKS
ncbi:hypothetical protein AB0J01_41340 [Streptomyces sp. NPDC050204]|uniref:hypothetical protein n=1 Tax=Streptomyces sp. NPDC050204 TaxID=3155514 RepID=UPI0034377CBD